MARNNMCMVMGDITQDIYYDMFDLDHQLIPFLRVLLMVNATKGCKGVKGLRVVAYGPLANLARGYLQKGSRILVIGHLQIRNRKVGESHKLIFEVVADEIQFIKNIRWEEGEKNRLEMEKNTPAVYRELDMTEIDQFIDQKWKSLLTETEEI
jgi:single-stranded DNA-binding protein